MKKQYPNYTDFADLRNVCTGAYIYYKTNDSKQYKYKLDRVFAMRVPTVDEILARQCRKLCEGTAYINMLGGTTDENI